MRVDAGLLGRRLLLQCEQRRPDAGIEVYGQCNTNTNAYTDPDRNAHAYPNNYSDTDCYPNGNPYSYSYRDTYANSNNDTNTDSASTNTYANADIDPYTDTTTGYSLSAVSDDRPYQGSQHPVQFHGISKRH